MRLAIKHNLIVIEDAAQAIDSYYTNLQGEKKALGSIGHMATFSFHETKNIISGEGGMLVVNDEVFINRAEIIWEKGTNRAEFFRGEVNKYGWVDTGSSFLPSEIIAAFLWAQIENIETIQAKRKKIWMQYYTGLSYNKILNITLPQIPKYATNNAHMFYILTKNLKHRTKIINKLKEHNFNAVFHYISLHSSPFYKDKHDGRILENSDLFTNNLLRLPFYYELSEDHINEIINLIE